MKVSVIIPCYNSVQTIENSLYSVLEQSYSDIEVIVVDDCSNDGTAELLKRIEANNANVSIYSTLNNTGSPAVPRNIGLEKSTGMYVCFLDSDDSWYPKKIEEQVKFMLCHNCEFSYLAYDISKLGSPVSSYVPPKSVSYDELLKLNVIGCLTVMIKRDIIGTTRFEKIDVEDYSFWLNLLKKIDRAYLASDYTLANYNLVENSRSSKKISLLLGYYKIFYKSSGSNIIISLFLFVRYFFNFINKY